MQIHIFSLFIPFFIHVAAEVTTSDQLHALDQIELAERQQDELCRELKIGELRVVNFSSPYNSWRWGKSPDNYKMNYVLKKNSEKKYELIFNIKFQPDWKYKLEKINKYDLRSLDKTKVQSAYEERVRQCSREASDLLASSDGVKFEIKLNTAESKKIGPTTISITSANNRADDITYNSNIDCLTIIHELLHLAGLCDEYNESLISTEGIRKQPNGKFIGTRSVKVNWADCRPKATAPSIMNNHYDFYEGYYPKQRNLCICTKDCLNNFSVDVGFNDLKCPQNFSDTNEAYWDYYLLLKSHNLINVSGIVKDNKIDEQRFIDELEPLDQNNLLYGPLLRKSLVLRSWEATPNYLLHRAHSRHLIYPGCNRKNMKYYRCAATAYETSTVEGCSDVPEYCSDGSWLK